MKYTLHQLEIFRKGYSLNRFILGKRIVGNDYPPLIIAEIGINHNGSLDKAICKDVRLQKIRSCALANAASGWVAAFINRRNTCIRELTKYRK